MRAMRNNPCRGCVAPKRHPGCHATCVDYMIAKAFHEAEREEEKRQLDVSLYSMNVARRNKDKAEKRKQSFRGHSWPHKG